MTKDWFLPDTMNKNEAFSRVIIDGLLADQGWNTTDPNAVRYEVVMGDATRADYVLCNRHGHSLAVIKRLFEANAITRVLFLVDRIPLAKQTEDAFAEHLPDYPAYVLRAGRRFQDEKRITITTLQSMINIYSEYSSGYFDLVISDECHRSIYGKWSGVLKHFDGTQIGLTATPCIANLDGMEGDEEDKLFVRDTLRFFEVDVPIFTYKLKDAIRDGVLAPARTTHWTA